MIHSRLEYKHKILEILNKFSYFFCKLFIYNLKIELDVHRKYLLYQIGIVEGGTDRTYEHRISEILAVLAIY